jgi:undecaprenyl-diphosphatase
VDPGVEGSNPFCRPFVSAKGFPLTLLQAIILGIVQGITEFFPISSSGHLELIQTFMELEPKKLVLFNLFCHLGTLSAICTLLHTEIRETFFLHTTRLKQLLIALLPLFPLLLFLPKVKAAFGNPQMLGYTFLISAFMLFVGRNRKTTEAKNPVRDACIIGCMQAVAILPGISRSGSTISTARLLGWSRDESFKFSFLLSIPTILGGVFLEIFKLSNEEIISLQIQEFLAGFSVSFLVGFLSLRFLLRSVNTDIFPYFSIYCFFLGIVCFIIFS